MTFFIHSVSIFAIDVMNNSWHIHQLVWVWLHVEF